MKTIKDFINEAAVVKLDPSLTISLNAKTNEYTVNYTDKRGKAEGRCSNRVPTWWQ